MKHRFFDAKLRQEKIITSPLSIYLLNCGTHLLVSLINETNEYDKLFKEITQALSNIEINEADFERKKKVLISNEIFSYENIEAVNDMIMDNIIFDNKIEDNVLGLINSLNLKELNELLSQLDLTNTTTIVLTNK